MRRALLSAGALCLALTSIAQTAPRKMKNPKWNRGGMVSIVGAQTGSRNFTVAPEKYSLTGVASAYLFANKSWGRSGWDTVKYESRHNWNTSVDLSYGLSNVQSSGIRKVDDKLELHTRYTFHAVPRFGLGFQANLRTQFSNGYDYSESPRRRISGFFAPAYLSFSPGMHWAPSRNTLLAVGVVGRWVIVSNNPYSFNYQGGVKPTGETERTLASIYEVDPERTSRFEIGPMVTLQYNRNVFKNVHYRTRLDASYDTKQASRNGLDVYWTNNVTMSVNKWLKVVYNYDLIYDGNVKYFGPNKNQNAIQMRSVLGVGVGVAL
ncbi:DUF3078 domain-containing protein [Flaviaesturariibacter amylovorans]|uniref:DUF3078 domain-containing protein n=1 Tax=Flaviaesturariibacter amylovorans TaxID=1084520 RepID=A0ABP8H8Z9_9BACT